MSTWNRLSLRQQLLLPIAAMIISALLSGVLALEVFSPDQFEYENEQESSAARSVAAGLNAALSVANDPRAILDAFVGKLGETEAIRYLPGDAIGNLPLARVESKGVPAWFTSHLAIPELSQAFDVRIAGARVGRIAFIPDLSADLWEKWIGFLAIVFSSTIPMFLVALVAYLTVGSALRPLHRLGAGLTRMRAGDYNTIVPVVGPPEIRRSCEETNELAAMLKRFSRDNGELLRRLVTLQDDERRELARELHDEMGPLLFAIRANATALSEPSSDRSLGSGSPAERVMSAAEALSRTNQRILSGLSPLYLQELGLVGSIESLLRDARIRAPAVQLTSQFDRGLDSLDAPLSQTVYRVIQESVTNALRHAQATTINVTAAIAAGQVTVEVTDNGVGLPADLIYGRGLTGMFERVRAFDGSLELSRERDQTIVRCYLPRR